MKQAEDNRTMDFMDIVLFPDGTWCYRYETGTIAPDCTVLYLGSLKYLNFVQSLNVQC